MQTTMAVEDIKVTLPELLDSMTPGDEVILTRNQQPVAKLVSEVHGVNLLLDSHTLLWLMEANANLSGRAAALIADPANRLYLSMASIWEIAIKSGLGKMGLSVPFQEFLDAAINGYGLIVLPINTDDCVRYEALPFPDKQHRPTQKSRPAKPPSRESSHRRESWPKPANNDLSTSSGQRGNCARCWWAWPPWRSSP